MGWERTCPMGKGRSHTHKSPWLGLLSSYRMLDENLVYQVCLAWSSAWLGCTVRIVGKQALVRTRPLGNAMPAQGGMSAKDGCPIFRKKDLDARRFFFLFSLLFF